MFIVEKFNVRRSFFQVYSNISTNWKIQKFRRNSFVGIEPKDSTSAFDDASSVGALRNWEQGEVHGE